MRNAILFLILPLLLACNTGDAAKGTIGPDVNQGPTADELVIQNCYAVRDAVEAYAAENNGLYPDAVTSQLPDGRELRDFLPGGEYLANPYTGSRTEPWDGPVAYAGSTGYRRWNDSTTSEPRGYVIDGIDGNYETIVHLEKDPRE
jgi:hypothetical protein